MTVVDLLNQPVDLSSIKLRSAGTAGDVPYLDRETAISTMNRIFGNLNWGYEATLPIWLQTHASDDPNLKDKYGGFRAPGMFICTVTVWYLHPTTGERLTITEVGTATPNKNTPDQYDLAALSATATGLKRGIAKLGPALGLDLYDAAYRKRVTDTIKEADRKRVKPVNPVCFQCQTPLTAVGNLSALDVAHRSLQKVGRVTCPTCFKVSAEE